MQNAQVVEPVSLFAPRAFDEQKVKQSITHISDSPVILLLVVAPAFSIPGHLAFVTGPGLIAPIVVPKVLLVYPIFSSIPCHALIELLKGNHACRDSLILPFLVSILPMMETTQGQGSRERIKDKGSYGVIPEVDDLGGGVGSKRHLLSVLVFPGVPDRHPGRLPPHLIAADQGRNNNRRKHERSRSPTVICLLLPVGGARVFPHRHNETGGGANLDAGNVRLQGQNAV